MNAATVPTIPPAGTETTAPPLATCHGCLAEFPTSSLRPCCCGAVLCPECAVYWGSHDHSTPEAER